jgi:hypothetical protein
MLYCIFCKNDNTKRLTLILTTIVRENCLDFCSC